MRIYGWNRYDVAAIIGSAIVIAMLLLAGAR